MRCHSEPPRLALRAASRSAVIAVTFVRSSARSPCAAVSCARHAKQFCTVSNNGFRSSSGMRSAGCAGFAFCRVAFAPAGESCKGKPEPEGLPPILFGGCAALPFCRVASAPVGRDWEGEPEPLKLPDQLVLEPLLPDTLFGRCAVLPVCRVASAPAGEGCEGVAEPMVLTDPIFWVWAEVPGGVGCAPAGTPGFGEPGLQGLSNASRQSSEVERAEFDEPELFPRIPFVAR